MYEDCRLLNNDPCLDVYCSSNEECYIFQPEDCGGCGPTPICHTMGSKSNENVTDSEVIASKNGSNMAEIKIYSYLFIILCIRTIKLTENK